MGHFRSASPVPTHVYLLPLAVKHQGTLATFGQAIPVADVLGCASAGLSTQSLNGKNP